MGLADANGGDGLLLRYLHDPFSNIIVLYPDHFSAQFGSQFKIVDQVPLCSKPYLIAILFDGLHIQKKPFGVVIGRQTGCFADDFGGNLIIAADAGQKTFWLKSPRGAVRFQFFFPPG